MSMSADTIVKFSLDALLLAAAGLNMFLAHRNIKGWRMVRAIRQIAWSYERDLAEMGVRLPPRCILCFQILPGTSRAAISRTGCGASWERSPNSSPGPR